jgi:hypothetical protein
MDISDSGEFTRRLIALGEVFDANLTPVKQALYFEALRDIPFEAVARSLNLAVKACTFMPKPAELRKLAIGDAEDRVETAWLSFRRALTSAGGYTSVVIADPALAETIVALFGSWPQACEAEFSPEMWAAKRKEFGRVYRVMADRGLVGGRYLPGIVEYHNRGRAEWMRYVAVAAIAGLDVKALSADEAEQARAALAAQASGLTQIAGGVSQALAHLKDATA